MTSGEQGRARRPVRWAALAVVAVAALGCAGEAPLSANRTTLYIFATYASPNITVSINGQALGTIATQYTGSPTDCNAFFGKGAADGVLSVAVAGGAHYAINWTYSNGKTDADSFDATQQFFQVPCLLEPIDPPPADITAGAARTRMVVGR